MKTIKTIFAVAALVSTIASVSNAKSGTECNMKSQSGRHDSTAVKVIKDGNGNPVRVGTIR